MRGVRVQREPAPTPVQVIQVEAEGAVLAHLARAAKARGWERGKLNHWRCPDCGVPCRCIGPAQLLPHQPCGLAPAVSS